MPRPLSSPHTPLGVTLTPFRAVVTLLRTAPGTYIWLAVLFLTTVVLHHMDPALADDFLRRRSTNIHHLSEHPVRVLVTSALWLDGGTWRTWLLYAVLYSVFHAPAERRLGTLRWFAVVAAAHIGATYLGEGVLGWAIRHGIAQPESVNTLDVGVSYALAGVVAVLTYRIPSPWRYVYLFGVLTFYALPLVNGRTFTDIGHFSAVLIGLACYPLTRNPGPRRLRTSRTRPAVPPRTPAP